MTRSNKSARQAGTSFETLIVDTLAWVLKDDRIERRAKKGRNDCGDIAGLRSFRNARIVIECKNVSRLNLGGWMEEAADEAGNDDAPIAVVIHKRRGRGNPLDQYVTMRVRDFVKLGWDADVDDAPNHTNGSQA
jgi:hypothetical protein